MDNLAGTSNISSTVFDVMAELQADYMRHVPWFPYPRLAVAELAPPETVNGTCRTFWNFTYIDPITIAVLNATKGHGIVLGFATSPEWMWANNVTVPPVNIRDVPYEQGKTLRDPTFKEITSYFVRLAQYYTKGGFTDECGNFIKGYSFPEFAWWEVFNEIGAEHKLSVQYYDQIYDSIVVALQKVMPGTRFLGLALGSHNQFEYYQYHLNASNHVPKTVPLDGISYHQYVSASGTVQSMAKTYFSQMDQFVVEVNKIETIKKSLSPATESFINEIGCASSSYMEEGFYQMCGATYAYLFAKASPLGVQHFGMSQVVGFTGASLCEGCADEWPSTSMVDWYSGAPNARYWILKMLIEAFPTGVKTVHPTTSAAGVAVQGYTVGGVKKVLLVSTTDAEMQYQAQERYSAKYVDNVTTGNGFSCVGAACIGTQGVTAAGAFTLRAYAVAVLTLVE